MSEYSETLAVLDDKPLQELFSEEQITHIRTTQPVGLLDHLTGESHGSIGIKQPMYWPAIDVILTASEFIELTRPINDLAGLEEAARTLLDLFESGGRSEMRSQRTEMRSRASAAWKTVLSSGLTLDQSLEYVCYGRVESPDQFLQWVLTFIASNTTARQLRTCDRMMRAGARSCDIETATGMTPNAVVRHRAVVGIPAPSIYVPTDSPEGVEFVAVVAQHVGPAGRGRNGGFRVGYRKAVERFGPRLSERSARRAVAQRQLVMA